MGFCVHGSSCGTCRDVLHSPCDSKLHRCHYNCRGLVLCVGRLHWLCGFHVQRRCLRRDVVWWWRFHSRWCIRFSLGCDADEGIYTFIYFQYQEVVGCVCMLNGWFSSNDTICADNYIYFRFKLQACVAVRSGSCICTAIWPIMVDRDSVEVLPWGVPPPWFSPNSATAHTPSMCCACLLSVALA